MTFLVSFSLRYPRTWRPANHGGDIPVPSDIYPLVRTDPTRIRIPKQAGQFDWWNVAGNIPTVDHNHIPSPTDALSKVNENEKENSKKRKHIN